MLLWRNAIGLIRDPIHAKTKISQNVFTALVSLAVFSGQYGHTFAQNMSLIGSVFFICTFISVENAMNTVLAFQGERPVFLREQADKMYSVSAYYLARLIIDTPVSAVLPFLFSLIVYFKIGFTVSYLQFSLFYLTLLLLAMATSGFGYLLSTTVQSPEAAVPLVNVIMMPLIQFGGFLVNAGTIPWYLRWFQYLSPVRYAMESITTNEFQGKTYNLQLGEGNPVEYLGFNMGIQKCLLCLLALSIGLRLLSMICLKIFVSRFQ
jgi:ABC-type multidrug transport system permease subunit